MTQPRLIALDFDGVVCDSIDECLITAMNAWHKMHDPNVPWLSSKQMISTTLRSEFHAWRYLVRPARHYGVLIQLLLADTNPQDQEAFDAFAESTDLDLAAFDIAFFSCREQLRRDSPEAWLKLHRLYPQNDSWFSTMNPAQVHIVTTKDAASVKILGRHFGLGFRDENIWDKDRTADKAVAIHAIASDVDHDTSGIVFVDDHPDHLALVRRKTLADCRWASWGYTPASAVDVDASRQSISCLSEVYTPPTRSVVPSILKPNCNPQLH